MGLPGMSRVRLTRPGGICRQIFRATVLSQGQPIGCSDSDSGAHIRHHEQGQDVRCGFVHPSAETFSSQGVGQVFVGGSSLPAVRVDLNPLKLSKYGISLEDVRSFLAGTNANRPKGELVKDDRTWEIRTNDQLSTADEYLPLVITYRSGAAVRLSDVANVQDSVEDLRTAGMVNGKPAVMLVIFRQPGANIIETVDNVRSLLPQLGLPCPGPSIFRWYSIEPRRFADHSGTWDGPSYHRDFSLSWWCSGFCVISAPRSSRLFAVASVDHWHLRRDVPVRLLAGHLSLMALTVATGFVVDDAIVVLENITRYGKWGNRPCRRHYPGQRKLRSLSFP